MATLRRMTRPALVMATVTVLLMTVMTLFQYQNAITSVVRELQIKPAPFTIGERVFREWSVPSSEATTEEPQRESNHSGVRREEPQRESDPSGVRREEPQRESGPSGVSRGEQQERSPSSEVNSEEQKERDEEEGPNASPVINEPQTESAPSGVTGGEEAEEGGQVMRARAQHLYQACRQPRVRQLTPTRPWTTMRHMVLRPFPLCVVNKGGSISWKSFMRELSRRVPGSRRDMKTVVVRHPLSRLASAYRDKFLNGSPLKAYNETFRRVTGSRQTWLERWRTYWLPALIHKGLVEPSPRFLEVISEASEAFKFVAERVDASGHLRLNASSTPAFGYTPDALNLSMAMTRSGTDLGMYAAVEAGYPGNIQTKLQERFIDSSFTFVEFLEHVAWTWEIGLVDRHWAPISELCDPCRGNYTFVLHLENPEESSYLLGLLQSQKNTTVPRRHLSIGASSDQYDLRYYRDVPKDLKAKIIKLYWLDFHLFGYSRTYI